MRFVLAAAACLSWIQLICATHYPHLSIIEKALTTTAANDFGGYHGAFAAASNWQWNRLKKSDWDGWYLACSDYGVGQQSLSILNEAFSPQNVRKVVHNKEHGVCFLVSAHAAVAEEMLEDPTAFGLTSAAAFPSTLKLSPGMLNHGAVGGNESGDVSIRLSTTHGESLALEGTVGLNVQVLLGFSSDAAKEWQADWASPSLDLYSLNFWSDPSMLDGEGMHSAHPGGTVQVREWTRAAKVVHDLSSAKGLGVGQTCGWNNIKFRNVRDNHVVLTGLEHLLPGGDPWTRLGDVGIGLEGDADSQMACLMGLISYLLSRPEVVRVTPEIQKRTLNAVATAITQSATITDKPLTLAGLDGSGEVIQVTDTGLDETSCFFTHGDDTQIEHGYYYDELFLDSGGNSFVVDNGGDYFSDLSRRKVVQYIDLLKPDYVIADLYSYYGSSLVEWFPAEGFGFDEEDGHGTHVGGSAAGSTLNSPPSVVECPLDEELVCSGKCVPSYNVTDMQNNGVFDIETYCPDYDCDGVDATSPNCLGNDRAGTLSEHEGMAPGAKIAVFDLSGDGNSIFSSALGNGLWEAAADTGAKIHTNSWGRDSLCQLDSDSVLYDGYLYENVEHLLIFAAGNDGDYLDSPTRTTCTVNVPGIGKNGLAVGATSSGETRSTLTNEDGNDYSSFWSSSSDRADIDTRAFFSSYGPTVDSRIKPELVAPGDRVFSVSSDGLDDHSCQLVALFGTSMSTPIVAGAAAMVRQYFKDEAFYLGDLNTRGVCDNGSSFICEAFSPSGATVKAVLINSANLMGGDSEPNSLTGFGRVHLEAGLPLNGNGSQSLFVADSSIARVYSGRNDSYKFEVGESGVEIRATLAWMDPEADVLAAVQLMNDLDLKVTSPSGEDFVMWSSGEADTRNVVERVIIPAEVVEEGTWTIMVTANELITEVQSYSLVVLGSIFNGTVIEGEDSQAEYSNGSLSSFRVYSWTTWTSTAIALVVASLFGLYGVAL